MMNLKVLLFVVFYFSSSSDGALTCRDAKNYKLFQEMVESHPAMKQLLPKGAPPNLKDGNCTEENNASLKNVSSPVSMNGGGLQNESGGRHGHYSPVILNHDWPRLERLVIVLTVSSFGTTMNGFFLSSFFAQCNLDRAGNVFLACLGLADMIITGGVMPVPILALLSAGEYDTPRVCKALHFLTETASYSYSIFFTLVASENFYRICRPMREYEIFLTMRTGVVSSSVFSVSAIVAAIGVYLDLDYDYCGRSHHGNFFYRVTTGLIFYAIPFLLTLPGLIISAFYMRIRARKNHSYRRSPVFRWDKSINSMNIMAYLLYVGAWTPYVLAVFEYPDPPDSVFYNRACLAVFRSALTSFLYGSLDTNFRKAFADIFYYCCLKSPLTGGFTSRHRRAYGNRLMDMSVVYMVRQPVTLQRAGCVSGETQAI